MNYGSLQDRLIEKYGTWDKPVGRYTERHRKIPGCHNGKYVKGNAFYVPARVHFILHYVLAKIHPNDVNLGHALFRMSNSRKYGSKVYAWAKEHWADLIRCENNPAKRLEVRKKISENNPMKDPEMVARAAEWIRSEEGRKCISERFSGSNNPSCREEVKQKRRENAKERWERGDTTFCAYGDANPLRNPEIKAKVIATKKLKKAEAESRGETYGVIPPDKHCMKKPEYKKAASDSAKKQWQDPEMRAKMSAAIKASIAKKKLERV